MSVAAALPGALLSALLSSLLLLLPASPVPAQQRIASLNLCTDLLLLELVGRERIVSLSYWAADPELSYLADRAAGLHLNKSLAEQLVPRQPDLVLAGQFGDPQLVGLLRQLGYRVEVLQVPANLAGMRAHILAFGALVGIEQRARQLADGLDARLDRVSARAESANGSTAAPLAVVYGPQGVSPGRGTLMHDLLLLAGFRNLAAELGVDDYSTLSLEQVARAQPDLVVIDSLSRNPDSLAHWALRHPVLARLLADRHTLELPPALTACVGPPAVDVAEMLLARRLEMQAVPAP